MSVSDDYEIKFHPYQGNEQDINVLHQRYIRLRDDMKQEDGVMARVIGHFYNGLVSMVEADKLFWDRNYRESFLSYQESIRLFNNFTISRSVKVKLDQFVNRLTFRANGMKLLIEGILSISDVTKDSLMVQSMEEFNSEIQLANEMGEQMSSYAAFARASFSQSQLLYWRAKSAPSDKSGEAKKNVLDSRDALRQAAFIDKRYLIYIDEISDLLDVITRKRLLAKGEDFADTATSAMENGKFNDATLGFNKASLFYKRASVLASDGSSRRMLLAFSTLYEASIKEAKATEAQRDINLSEAADYFLESMKLVDKALALLGHFGSETLVKSFKCQRDYYSGMYNQNLATQEFDIENYEGAKDKFTKAAEIFESAIQLAREVENSSIANISQDAVSEIASYITMCENLA